MRKFLSTLIDDIKAELRPQLKDDTDHHFNQIKSGAESGDPEAQYEYGRHYYFQSKGLGHKQAAIWFHKAAEQNHLKAQHYLGRMYSVGRGVEKNLVEAFKWHLNAANLGDADSQETVGVYYQNGWGIDQDYFEAAKWYQKAADQDHFRAINYLGHMYLNGRGVKQDPDKALKLYLETAEQGYPLGMLNIGSMYENGKGVEQNNAEALKWYWRAASEHGDSDGHCLALALEEKIENSTKN